MKIVMIAIAGLSMSWLNISYSQSKDFLRNYKAPDFKYNSLDITLSAGSSSSQTNGNGWRQFTASKNFVYFQRINSSKYQGTVRIDPLVRYQNHKNGSNKIRTIRGWYDVISENRFFVKEKDFFVGAHISSQCSHFYRDQFNLFNQTPSSINQEFLLFAAPKVSVGWGRLEPVHFARQALDINMLLSKDFLLPELNDDQLITLGNKIAEVQNLRFFDHRLGAIYQLEAIDSTVQNLGVLKEKNMRYFSRMQDAFFYARANERLSGTRHEAGIISEVRYDPFEDDELIGGLGLFYELSHHTPISYALQHDFRLRAYSNGNFAQIRYSYNFGFYPNTRTSLTASFTVGASHRNELFGFIGYGGIGAKYYISPRLRLSARYAINYNNDYQFVSIGDLNTDERFFSTYQITFNCALF